MDRRKPRESTEQIGGERRSDRRYDIALDVRWKLLRRNKTTLLLRRRKTLESSHGRTVDLSSGGILFETGRKLPVGLKVQLSIAWPVPLHAASQVQLMVAGRVVRSDSQRAAIRIVQHEFHTLGVSVEQRGAPSERGL